MKKLVLITGVTGGLGSHMADCALRAGYDVVGLARAKPDKEPGFPCLQTDVGDAASVAAAFGQLRSKPLWAVINAAGIASMNLALTTPTATMERVVRTNLLGTMYCCAEAAKVLLRQKGGRIINFSTIAVSLALAGESVYAASKAGVETFSRCLARELSGFGITVNTVAPGPIDTRMTRNLRPEQVDAVVNAQIIRRKADPEDVWKVVSFLLGEESAMVTGEVLHIGGV